TSNSSPYISLSTAPTIVATAGQPQQVSNITAATAGQIQVTTGQMQSSGQPQTAAAVTYPSNSTIYQLAQVGVIPANTIRLHNAPVASASTTSNNNSHASSNNSSNANNNSSQQQSIAGSTQVIV